ncbi:MAG: sulfurtransferase TusA family protein [Rhodospirillales bacterium]
MQQTKDQNSAVTELDASGLKCPMPVLRANRALRNVAPGGLLRVRATDPAAQADFPSFCQTTGHALVEAKAEDDAWVFLLRKKS